jgi:hypothetical protein
MTVGQIVRGVLKTYYDAVEDYVRELRVARNLQAVALDAGLLSPGDANGRAHLPRFRAALRHDAAHAGQSAKQQEHEKNQTS